MNALQTIGSVSVFKATQSLAGDYLTECMKAIESCLVSHRTQIVIDLGDTPLINSQGLEFLVDVQHRCLTRAGKLVLADPQPLCAEILEITGVESRIAVYKDLREALGEFAR